MRGGFLGGGSCRKGNLRERHEREGEMSHARGGFWGKGMTGKASCVMPERNLWERHDREGEMSHAGKGFCGVGMSGKAR